MCYFRVKVHAGLICERLFCDSVISVNLAYPSLEEPKPVSVTSEPAVLTQFNGRTLDQEPHTEGPTNTQTPAQQPVTQTSTDVITPPSASPRHTPQVSFVQNTRTNNCQKH